MFARQGRLRAFFKAAAATSFTYHEVKIALQDARSSELLSKLVAPLTALDARFAALRTKLKGGKLDPSADVNAANGDVESVRGQSAGLGATIRDRTAAVPGT